MAGVHEALFLERRPEGWGRSFSAALALARATGARLTLAGVLPNLDGPLEPGGSVRRQAMEDRLVEHLETLASRAGREGARVRVRVLQGRPSDAVARAAREGGHDLVLTSADPGSSPAPWRRHAEDRRLVRLVPCPTWILHPAQGPGLRCVLAAVDVGDGGPLDLATEVVATAVELADRAGAQLRVLHAWSLLGEPLLADHLVGLSSRRMRTLQASIRRERRSRLEEVVRRAAPGRSIPLLIVKGYPVPAIRAVAQRTEADLVVVGSTGGGGLSAILGGHVAERLVGAVPGSVLALKAPHASIAGSAPVERGVGAGGGSSAPLGPLASWGAFP